MFLKLELQVIRVLEYVRVFLVDCLMCPNISLTVLKISKSSLSVSILVNLQASYYSIAFYLFIS